MNLPPSRAVLLSLVVCFLSSGAVFAQSVGRAELDLSGPDWKLWLDREATWKEDKLFFPVPALEALPVNLPTGGWDALSGSVAVKVPGTVEEYLQTAPSPEGDITGVSWWVRKFELPADPASRRVLLRFDSLRQRAEIFVNRHLVGYDVVGNSPVEVDITTAVGTSRSCELAVRVTDPGGNFDWRDSSALHWGNYLLPMSHGFGGVTGNVRVVVCNPIHVSDLYVQNTPAITAVNAFVTVRNESAQPQRRDLIVRISPKGDSVHPIFKTSVTGIDLPVGETVVPVKVSVPDAALWDIEHPNLYVCDAVLGEGTPAADSDRRIFGFRWFAPDNIGTDAVLRLNGQRIVLRSAISWGFWPTNGIFPTEQLAERQVLIAKTMGLNMLNFHRAIGNPIVFEKADELGLLYFEEPGAYKSADRDSFGHALAREKFLRMVKRDRSHPSLVIYNLINEWDSRNPNPNPAEIERHRLDLLAAHQLDPSRVVLHTSAWARGKEIDDPAKLHFRPFDDTPYWNGWYDVHHAGGPAVWNESMYRSPTDYYGLTDNRREIVFWGEEGALSTPPRLEKIKAELDALPRLGWDGDIYQDWFKAFDSFLTRKNLRPAFADVDALTVAMGNISLYHQGRRIENVRLSNVTDGYAINGWEAETIENHSGIVDCFRNPKGDPTILAHYNQPLYVAVKVRNTIVTPGRKVVADFFVINERNLTGPHRLVATLRDSAGHDLAQAERDVVLKGDDTYGELLAEAVELTLPATVTGLCRVEARLLAPTGLERATGRDDVLAVDWRRDPLTGEGAVWESGNQVRHFLQQGKGRTIPAYARDSARLDWIIAVRAPLEGEPVIVPAASLLQASGSPGLQTAFFSDQKFQHQVHQRIDGTVALSVDDGASPDAALSVMTNYGVRWEGTVTALQDGPHTFAVRTNGRVRLTINGKTLIDFGPPRGPQPARGQIDLRAGTAATIRLEFLAGNGAAQCELGWIPPESDPTLSAHILDRVRRDGATLVVLERADAWLALLAKEPGATFKYTGSFRVGKTWLGGDHFVREHPLFRDLPVNGGLDWPYQNVVRNGDERLGLLVEGEELVVGAYHSFPMQLGTAVGVVPVGRGHVIFSTLDITANLAAPEGPADIARKLLGNYLWHATNLARSPSTDPAKSLRDQQRQDGP
jgi:beta-galactosidase